MRRLPAVAALAVSLFMLVGCATIPTSGPVEVEGAVAANDLPPAPVALVSPPADGATPSEIVAGFLTANAVPTDDYAVARTFLSPEIQESWNPDAGAIVYSDGAGYSLTSRSTSEVRLLAAQQGALTPDAQYLVARPDARVDQSFVLRRIDGQWRILELRDGLLLTARDLARIYGGYDVYYLNPDGSVLVPDRVLFSDRPGLGATLMRRLLAGPSAWLAPAVVSAFPTGTALAIDATPIDDGVISVELTDDVLKADDASRRLLAAQIVWTLTALPNVDFVRITVSGQPLAIGGAGDLLNREQFAALNPNVLVGPVPGYAAIDGRLSVLAATPTAVPGVFGQGSVSVRLAAVSLNQATAGAESRTAALRGTVFVAALDAAASPTPRTRMGSITAMTFDRTGALFVSGGSAGSIREIPAGSGTVGVRVTGSPQVLRVAVARDGTRVALVVRGGSPATDELYVARVVRNGNQVRFDGLRRIENELSQVVDVAWADADRLAVVAPAANGTTRVYDVVVGGTAVVDRGGVPAMVKVAAAPDSPILVQASGGVWQETGSQWRRITEGISPAYPG